MAGVLPGSEGGPPFGCMLGRDCRLVSSIRGLSDAQSSGFPHCFFSKKGSSQSVSEDRSVTLFLPVAHWMAYVRKGTGLLKDPAESACFSRHSQVPWRACTNYAHDHPFIRNVRMSTKGWEMFIGG
ncbi:hypothetical protein AA313_de0206631 [Arthrobotrys entomopaga]|nr:hypothetical protein AA313_de0206631 [Arthrobotrys entomopaga]